ncbi:MAG: hypothetical protein ACI9EF_002332 [Pseudohongiellaceae bacterium]
MESEPLSWDAVLVDFENTLADLSRGARVVPPPEYYGGGPQAEVMLDGDGAPVGELLMELARRAVPWGVVSSSPVASVLRWLSAQGWPTPPVCIGFGDTPLHRPSESPILAALGRLGVEPSRSVLSIGDSGTDVEAAHRAGVTSASLFEDVPLLACPDLLLSGLAAVFDDKLGQHWLLGERRKGRPGVSLSCPMGQYDLHVAGMALGRLVQAGPDEQSAGNRAGLARELRQGRLGAWAPETVDLAQALLMHAQKGQPGGTRLTWVPDRVPMKGPLERLARRLAGRVAIPCHSLLRHVAASPEQFTLPLAERRTAMVGKFTATAALDGDTVLVLDDTRVTGATLEEAARALREAGAGHVACLALGQVPLAGDGPMARWGPKGNGPEKGRPESGGQSLFC